MNLSSHDRQLLRDTHTCEHQAGRFDEWTRIGREVIEEIFQGYTPQRG